MKAAPVDWPFPRAAYIDHDRDFHRLLKTLSAEDLIAFDTESNSLYAYRERVCLIQISTRTMDAIVDPLRIADLGPLGRILADPAIEKVFHAAEYDIMCLKRDYGFEVANLFDTMLAARICGHRQIGLDKLLAEHFGIQADKSHQRDNWGERPLSEDGLLYAQMDTHYLPALRDRLANRLEAQGLMNEARETFADYCAVPAADNRFDPDGYWRIGIPADLNRRQMALLREVYLLREKLAEARDCPPFKVFTDKVLVALAEAAPGSLRDLHQVRGLTALQVKRYGRPLLDALERGRRAPTPHPPAREHESDPLVVERYAALRDWRRERAERRGVDSDVILSKDALWSLARRAPRSLDDMRNIRGLGPWKLTTYGAEILDVVMRFDNGVDLG